MCTNFVLVNQNGTTILANRLGVQYEDFIGGDFKPGSTLSIVREHDGNRTIETATWWLYLQQTDKGLRPDKRYFSVNTNWKKLSQKWEYKKTRCIIPATAFVESQEGKRPHLLEPADGSAIAFGGLYKEWTDTTTGEILYSASLITLPGHPALADIHRKSVPLWLPESAYDNWLDSKQTDTTLFKELLIPKLHTELQATPIDNTFSKNPLSPPIKISAAVS